MISHHNSLNSVYHEEVKKKKKKIESVLEPRGPSNRRLHRFPWREATRCITTLPFPLGGMPVHSKVTPSICWYSFLQLWVEEDTVKIKCVLPKNTVTRPGLHRTLLAEAFIC